MFEKQQAMVNESEAKKIPFLLRSLVQAGNCFDVIRGTAWGFQDHP